MASSYSHTGKHIVVTTHTDLTTFLLDQGSQHVVKAEQKKNDLRGVHKRSVQRDQND